MATAGCSSASPLNCTDIEGSDRLFDSFYYETFVKPRDWEGAWSAVLAPVETDLVWSLEHITTMRLAAVSRGMTMGDFVEGALAPIGTPLPATVLPQPNWDRTAVTEKMIQITTRFNPALEENRKTPFGRTLPEREAATKKFRRWVEKNSKEPKTVEDFRTNIQKQLTRGHRTKGDVWTTLDSAIIDGQILKVSGVDEALVAIVLANMPQDLREQAWSALQLVFPGRVKHTDSSKEGFKYTVIHFSTYARMCTQGHGTPSTAEPSSIQREGCPSVNSSQAVPRTSVEGIQYHREQEILERAFEPIFDWITAQLRALLPETFKELEAFVDILPLGDGSVLYPFTGFALNFNFSGELEGGELCLYEPGLCVRLRNGDGIIFRSREISHFNMDYVGERASMVFHSDQQMDCWVKDRNGWMNNMYLRSFPSTGQS